MSNILSGGATNIIIGNFVNIDSAVHRLDPRTKLIVLMFYMVGIFFVDTFWGFALFGAVLVATVIAARLSIAKVFLSLKPLLFILVFTLLIDLFFVRTGEPLIVFGATAAQTGFVLITTGGLHLAAFMVTRLCLLFMSMSVLTLTTSNVALTDAIESLLKPLKIFGVEPHVIALVSSIALRFIPILLDEASKIRDAQLSRGAEFETGGITARLKAYVSLFIPLFIGAFRHAENLATAMEARCYHGAEGRTRMKVYHFGTSDYLTLALGVLLLLAPIVFPL